jgi:galactokinase/mevalonate kinase-like predicted kinase
VYTGVEDFSREKVRRLSGAGESTWQAIKKMDTKELGACVNETSDACHDMIPGYISEEVASVVERHRQQYLGVKMMGAGGYGYMMIVSEIPVEGSLKINVRRKLSI